MKNCLGIDFGQVALWLKPRLGIFSSIIVLMVLVEVINIFSNNELKSWGIWPRHERGLWGILFSPWLHADWAHMWNNLLALIPLGLLVSLRSVRYFVLASVVIILGSGLLTWALGREAIHIGASGWVFGLWGLVLGQAWFRRNLFDLAVALIVISYYGGIAVGLLPDPIVSFEGHWFGAIVGVLFAWETHTGLNKKCSKGDHGK